MIKHVFIATSTFSRQRLMDMQSKAEETKSLLRFTCPLRSYIASIAKDEDKWINDRCSFCGGVKSEIAMELIQDYIIYPINNHKFKVAGCKVYMQHLSEEQQELFVDMYNDGRICVINGGFEKETCPYFMKCEKG